MRSVIIIHPVKILTATLLVSIALTGLTGCGPTMYKSPMNVDLVAVTLFATELNQRSVLYTDELVAINLVDPVTEK